MGMSWAIMKTTSSICRAKRDYLRQNPYNDDLYEHVNNDDLYFDGGHKRDPYYRIEGVFSLGGYILKDKLWFLVRSTQFIIRQKPSEILIPARVLFINF